MGNAIEVVWKDGTTTLVEDIDFLPSVLAAKGEPALHVRKATEERESSQTSAPAIAPQPSAPQVVAPTPVVDVVSPVGHLLPRTPANEHHAHNTLYVYANGAMQKRGDVLQYMGIRGSGTSVRLLYRVTAQLVNGVIQPVHVTGGTVHFTHGDHGDERGRVQRSMTPQSARGDLIVLSYPDAVAHTPSPTQVQGFVVASSSTTNPKDPSPPEVDSIAEWYASRDDHYDRFIAERSSANRLISLAAPVFFSMGGVLHMELFSFKTKALFTKKDAKKGTKEELATKGVFDYNWALEDETLSSTHPMLVKDGYQTILKTTSGTTSRAKRSDEERIRKVVRLTTDQEHALKCWMRDSSKQKGQQNVCDGEFSVLNCKVQKIPFPKYRELLRAKLEREELELEQKRKLNGKAQHP